MVAAQELTWKNQTQMVRDFDERIKIAQQVGFLPWDTALALSVALVGS
jgi:hypothetical protein